ncbi:hypothetical protein [Sulfuracidifex metallicus]|uniref:Uncharacterized protein n=1 Tax=Sulfuracidifex metallicus DSM 6482 = JCM 9184 TaxID=523847 RepID=A0A6A9QLS0_SULME|nr:hypothetical protein [Sulfuracidifex metallicus]MUN29946.1 hypothetical protein [Sulfuracidifex metallicus DSM 6482 = JCM 9184]WOE51670.1 hypothetical protein RQ359_000995 [Sulfuracidifex metallicus DSM 6482 = JCM 9184]
MEKNLDISKDLELLEKVEVPPFGDNRNLMIVSRYDVSEVFRKYNATVLTRDLLSIYAGGGQVPDYAVVPRGRITLNYWVDESLEYKGNHGGYSREELEIPLCIFKADVNPFLFDFFFTIIIKGNGSYFFFTARNVLSIPSSF